MEHGALGKMILLWDKMEHWDTGKNLHTLMKSIREKSIGNILMSIQYPGELFIGNA